MIMTPFAAIVYSQTYTKAMCYACPLTQLLQWPHRDALLHVKYVLTSVCPCCSAINTLLLRQYVAITLLIAYTVYTKG
jgi:GTP cyclohydrolase FolE2